MAVGTPPSFESQPSWCFDDFFPNTLWLIWLLIYIFWLVIHAPIGLVYSTSIYINARVATDGLLLRHLAIFFKWSYLDGSGVPFFMDMPIQFVVKIFFIVPSLLAGYVLLVTWLYNWWLLYVSMLSCCLLYTPSLVVSFPVVINYICYTSYIIICSWL